MLMRRAATASVWQFNFVHSLSWSISSDFGAVHSWSVYGSLKSRKKNSRKNPILGVQCRSRSSTLVPTESSSAVLVTISSKSVYLHPFWR